MLSFSLQQTPGLFEIGGVKPMLLLPAVFALAAATKSPTLCGLIGLLFGLGWEVLAGRFVGYFSLFLMIGAVFMSLYRREVAQEDYFDEHLSTVDFILCTTVASAILCLGDLLIFGYLADYSSIGSTFSRHTLPTVLYTGLLSPIPYLICRLPDYFSLRTDYGQGEPYDE